MRNNGITIPATRASVPAFEKFLVFSIIGGSALSKADLLPGIIHGVSIADGLCACALVILISRMLILKTKFSFRYYRGLNYALLLCLWAIVGALFLSIASPFDFSETEFAKSFAKLNFYVIFAIFLSSYFRKFPLNVIHNIVLSVLVVNALIAIYIFVVMTFRIEIPYEFFGYNPRESFRGCEYYRTGGFVIARGIFAEPSLSGIFQSLGLSFLLFSSYSQIKIYDWKYLAIIASILLSFSLSGYLLLALVLLLYSLRWNLVYFRNTVILFIIIILLFWITNIYIYFNVAIFDRLFRAFHGVDTSVNARLLDSWVVPFRVMNDSTFFGIGLGNQHIAYPDLSKGVAEGWNILTYVFGSMGIIGFGIFILFIADLIFVNPLIGMVFLASMFTTGTFLEPPFWIFYCLFTVQAQRKKRLSKFIWRGVPKSRQCVQE